MKPGVDGGTVVLCAGCGRTAGDHPTGGGGTGAYCPGYYVAPKPPAEPDLAAPVEPTAPPSPLDGIAILPVRRLLITPHAPQAPYTVRVAVQGVVGNQALVTDLRYNNTHWVRTSELEDDHAD